MRRAYFFPHPLVPRGGLPGRVPFHVGAPLLSRDGYGYGEVIVCADGYWENTIGPNQDPCIFSSPGGPFLSFCRINGRTPKNYVRGTKLLLPQVVKDGDVIVFGKYDPAGADGPTQSVWVDTVLVVGRPPPVWGHTRRSAPGPCHPSSGEPQCREKRWTLQAPQGFAASITGADPDALTDAYLYNLRDAESHGTHCCTKLREYHIIVGAIAHDAGALAQLSTSFVPLAQLGADGRTWQPPRVTEQDFTAGEWTAIRQAIDDDVRPASGWNKNSGSIAQFEVFETAATLVQKIVERSGADQGRPGMVAIPPLEPPLTLLRYDPRIQTTTQPSPSSPLPQRPARLASARRWEQAVGASWIGRRTYNAFYELYVALRAEDPSLVGSAPQTRAKTDAKIGLSETDLELHPGSRQGDPSGERRKQLIKAAEIVNSVRVALERAPTVSLDTPFRWARSITQPRPPIHPKQKFSPHKDSMVQEVERRMVQLAVEHPTSEAPLSERGIRTLASTIAMLPFLSQSSAALTSLLPPADIDDGGSWLTERIDAVVLALGALSAVAWGDPELILEHSFIAMGMSRADAHAFFSYRKKRDKRGNAAE